MQRCCTLWSFILLSLYILFSCFISSQSRGCAVGYVVETLCSPVLCSFSLFFCFLGLQVNILCIIGPSSSPLMSALNRTSLIVFPFTLTLCSSVRSHSTISCRETVVVSLEPRLDQRLEFPLILKVSLIALFIWSERECICVWILWSLLSSLLRGSLIIPFYKSSYLPRLDSCKNFGPHFIVLVWAGTVLLDVCLKDSFYSSS